MEYIISMTAAINNVGGNFSGGINITNETVAVPVPIAGAGLPGLILAAGGVVGWWRQRQRQRQRQRKKTTRPASRTLYAPGLNKAASGKPV